MSTGIGTDNVEIAVAEILAITERPTFIRVGSCGALQPEMSLGDLTITTGAVRLESTTSFFVHDGYPAVAHYEAVAALIEAAERLGHRYHVGLTATAPGFFGAQGRPIPELPIRYPDLAEDMARQRVMNFEMEASALLVLSSLARCRAGVVCAVYANRTTGEFVAGDQKDAAEAACVDRSLAASRTSSCAEPRCQLSWSRRHHRLEPAGCGGVQPQRGPDAIHRSLGDGDHAGARAATGEQAHRRNSGRADA